MSDVRLKLYEELRDFSDSAGNVDRLIDAVEAFICERITARFGPQLPTFSAAFGDTNLPCERCAGDYSAHLGSERQCRPIASQLNPNCITSDRELLDKIDTICRSCDGNYEWAVNKVGGLVADALMQNDLETTKPR